ncbi:MAG TPA: BON domain-containing protein [Gemmatimonadaceae bacterium]|nr:BON domain-containing protein [Gemmatimonadaceae bacterium]
MKSNSQLQRDVADELQWDSALRGAEIGVAAKEGVVTLSGTVDSFPKKLAAIKAAERVAGVRGVADDMVVKIPGSITRNDTEIAHAAVNALRWDTQVPEDKIQVTIDEGWVTLDGSVGWHYQSRAAEHAVRYLTGVRGVTNRIAVKSPVSASAVKSKIEAALKRSAELDAQRINVVTADGIVTLSGTVRSWAERRDAERAAWNAPGVSNVRDDLAVTA